MATTLAACSDPRVATATIFRRAIVPRVVDRYCEGIRAATLDTLVDAGKPAPPWPTVLAGMPGLYEQMTRLDARRLRDGEVRLRLVRRTPRVILVRSFDDEPYRPTAALFY